MFRFIKKYRNKKIKQKWIDALNSGEYVQIYRARNFDDPKNHCCALDVLNDITGNKTYSGISAFYNTFPEDYDVCSEIWHLNDLDKKSFSEIAEYIEKNVKP